MAFEICRITGRIVDPTGEVVANSRIDFVCTDVIPSPPLTVVPEPTFTTTDEDGQLAVDLYPGNYSVRISRGTNRKYPTIGIVVPAALNARLSDIQSLPEPIDLDAAQLAVQATNLARDEAVQAAVDAQAIEDRIDLGALDFAIVQTGADRVQTGLDRDTAVVAASTSTAQATIATNQATSANASAASATASANEATTQAANASNAAGVASTKAGEASTSAMAAAGSANTSAAQAGIATSKANEALSSANSAAASAGSANASANTASIRAGEAATSAAGAAASANAAANSATVANTKSNEASNSATAASLSANTALSAANTATTQAEIATTKAIEAANSASQSANSANDASIAANTAISNSAIASTKATEAALSASIAAAAGFPLGSEILWNLPTAFPDGWYDTYDRLTIGTTTRKVLRNGTAYHLFLRGETGVWFDPSDKVPADWRKNLLSWTEDFSNAEWAFYNVSGGASRSGNTLTFGASDLDRITQSNKALPVGNYVASVVLSGTGSVRLYLLAGNGGSGAPLVVTLTDTPTRYQLSRMTTATGNFGGIGIFNNAAGTPSTVTVDQSQLELGSTATSYQKITDGNTEAIARYPNATLYQDVNGLIPASQPGETVSIMLDKSRGLVKGPESVLGFLSSGNNGVNIVTTYADGFDIMQNDTSSVATGQISGSFVVGRTYVLDCDASISAGSFKIQNNAWNDGVSVPITGGSVILRCTISAGSIGIYRSNPVGTAVGSFRNISVRELNGYHAVQTSASFRPTLARHPKGGRRNLVVSSNLSNFAWMLNSPGETISTLSDQKTPDGEDAYSVAIQPSGSLFRRMSMTNTGLPFTIKPNTDYRLSMWVFASSEAQRNAWYIYALGTNPSIASQITVGQWSKVEYTFNSGSVSTPNLQVVRISGSGFDGQTLLVGGVQFEESTITTPYQKVVSQYDVTEAGVEDCWGLYFDGVDDFMQTPAIDLTGTDKVGVFAGVRKLSDATQAVVGEFGNNVPASFGIRAPYSNGQPGYGSSSYGSTVAQALTLGFPAPHTAVLTSIGDISADVVSLRVNGAQAAQKLLDQGTGNYGNLPLYIGRRGGVSLSFNGNIYGLIVAGKLPSATEITSIETYINTKIGAY